MWRGRGDLICLLAVAVGYVLLAGWFNRFGAVWSPDSGARVQMVRQQVAGGSLVRRVYRFAAVDPDFRLDPFRGYSSRLPKGRFFTYPFLFPAVSEVAYRAFGWGGLALLPLLAGLVAVAATVRAGRELGLPGAPAAALMMGLGTPLLVYSTVFWDHSLQMACAGVFVWLLARAVRTGSFRVYAAAGVALGVGAWIHETLLALAVAALVSGCVQAFRRSGIQVFRRPVPRGRASTESRESTESKESKESRDGEALQALDDGRRGAGSAAGMAGMTLGVAVPVAVWMGVNALIYGAPLGPHLFAGPVDFRQPNYAAGFLDFPGILRRGMEQGFGSFQTGDAGWRLALAAAAFLLCSWISPVSRRVAPLVGVAAAYFAVASALDTTWAAGLLQAAPVLLFALAAPAPIGSDPGVRTDRDQGWKQVSTPGYLLSSLRDCRVEGRGLFLSWLRLAGVLYAAAVVVNPIIPGLNWGSRYLLTGLPLLALLAWAALVDTWRGSSGVRWPMRVAVVSLVGAAVVLQVRSVWAVTGDLVYSADARRVADSVSSPVLVTDVWWLAPEDAPGRHAGDFLLAETAAERGFLAETVRRLVPEEFAFVGTRSGLAQFKPLFQGVESGGAAFRAGPEQWGAGMVTVVFRRASSRERN